IPKVEVDRIWDLEPALLGELHVFSQKVALAMEDVMPCQRVGQAVIGLEVPHAHVHLIPLNAVADINFERPKLQVTQEELTDVAARIRGAFEARNPA
ncbi:MAG: HIT domain-containing protein, partial [Bacteroidota bacterium]|nr:HIT domain-containing protein [Bacteroidota bacterium]